MKTRTTFLDMFKDDVTGQYSLGRFLCFLCFVWIVGCSGHTMAHNPKAEMPDILNNWLVALLSFYGMNKGATVAQTIMGGKNVAKSDAIVDVEQPKTPE